VLLGPERREKTRKVMKRDPGEGNRREEKVREDKGRNTDKQKIR
jgi:hypothetical protein